MDRDTLIQHLRTAHGFADYEPGGEGHEPDVIGYPEPLDTWSRIDLEDHHDGDHHDYPDGGGGRNKHQHTERK